MSFQHLRSLGLATILAVLPLFSAAEAAVITFSDPAAPGLYDPFPQTLGDIPGLDVGNATRAGFGNTLSTSPILHWGPGYSELLNAGFAAQNGQYGELSFTPDSGMEVVLTSFVFGNYPGGNAARDVTFRVYDASWTQVWQYVVTGHTGNAQTVALNLVLDGPAYFQWGNDWNVGLGQFTYDVRLATSTVPVPATLPLLGAGLAGLAALRRRKKA